MHYYKFNIADYRKDTTHLSMLEHGIYRTLIDWYYLDEKPIPLDVEMVARRMRLSTEDDLKSLKLVLFDFFEKTDKGHKHGRINVEILGYHELAIKNAANGKLGGRPLKTQTVTSGNPNESDRKGNHKPLTINHKPITNNTAVATPEGVSISVWKDFLKIRKAKKSPMTETALKEIEAEAIKAGITLSKALEHCCTRGWAGFKASWLDGEKTAYTAQITVPGRQGVDPALAKAIADGLKATAPSAEIREKINQLRKSA